MYDRKSIVLYTICIHLLYNTAGRMILCRQKVKSRLLIPQIVIMEMCPVISKHNDP